MLDGEVDVVANGDRHTLRPGDVFWTGTGCVHAFYETQGGRVRWLETSAPGPPARHSYRHERDWDYLAGRLASDASVGADVSNISDKPETGGLEDSRSLHGDVPPDASHPRLRGPRADASSSAARCTARRTSTPGRRRSRSASRALARAGRPGGVHLPRPRPPARDGNRPGGPARGAARRARRASTAGRAGSMNVVDPEHGVLGCYGIVGGSIAAATGAGLSLRGTGAVAVAYFGDGTTNQAYFFECLNFAKVFELPVVFVCENNGYGEYTPFEAVTPGGIVPRAAVCELPTTELDGMDVRAVRAAARGDRRACPRRRRAGVRRGSHVPLRRAFAQRPWQVPARGRARPLAGARSARRRRGAAARRARHDRRRRVAQVADGVEAELDRIEAAALAAPFPGEIPLPEFNDGA